MTEAALKTAVLDAPYTTVEIDGLRTVSEANAHEHWRKRAKRARAQRTTACLAMRAKALPATCGPVTVRLTRIAPRNLDSDNAVGSCKHVRDGVADWLKRNDNDPLITWLYAQEKASKRYAVRIEVFA